MRFSIRAIRSILIFVILKPNHITKCEQDCRCVSLFLCDEGTEVDHDGRDVIDTRFEREVVRKTEDCDSPVEICCKLENILPPTKQMMSAKGCGTRDFDGTRWDVPTSMDYVAEFGEFPWTIAVLHNRPDKQDEYICDGALIHRKIVLTAAHCVDGKFASRIKIRAGEWDTETTDESLPHQDRAVESILIHRNYTSRLFRNDIALLVLSRSLEITKNVNIICLPESINDLKIGQCVTSGWSRDKLYGPYQSVLKKVELQIVSRDVCERALHKAYKLEEKPVLDESFICADDVVYGYNMWKGVGGSPFVCPLKTDSQRYVQIGVAAPHFGRSGQTPNIFASVLRARSWIDEQLLFHNLDNTEYQYEQSANENHESFGLTDD